MDPSVFLKENLSLLQLPLWFGQLIARVPYRWRPGIGSAYRRRMRDFCMYEELSPEERKEWIFQRVRNIAEYAVTNVPFYDYYYAEQGFDVEDLESFDDIRRIPVINKAKLQKHDLPYRSSDVNARYVANTGGSSGAPLSLYVYSEQMANECAHMHTIWRKLGYSPSCLKLMFGGRSDIEDGIRYDFLRHSVAVDIYLDFRSIARRLRQLLAKHEARYLHGYPSALYEFALACRDEYPELRAMLASTLRGGLLGSEYPLPAYRRAIEEVFEIPTVSWYGHTERCILAFEKNEPYLYHPFQTYGFAEIAETGDQQSTLVGTSYYNLASPLIRYDTEDQVSSAEIEGSILASFRLEEGRSGQFVLDRNGKKIPLTGLIFGRHHALFDLCSHIQVHQPEPGKAVILFVPLDGGPIADPRKHFDAQNVNMEFDFEMLEEPIRTSSGKINLRVREEELPRRHRLLS